MKNNEQYVLSQEADAPGGARPVYERLQCRAPCTLFASTAWIDYTVFIPNSANPAGPICELHSSLRETTVCQGDPRCQAFVGVKTLQDIIVAVKFVGSELTCALQYFKPFNRPKEDVQISMTEQDVFGSSSGAHVLSYNMYRRFVQNFDVSAMTITGDSWLTIKEGSLSGAPPKVGVTVRYAFVVTAVNGNGSDSLSLFVTVSP